MMNALIYTNSAADRWANWVIAATLDSAVLLALIGLVWFAIRKRVAPQVGYGLFLLVPLKLLLPVDVIVPSAIANWTPSGFVGAKFAPSLKRARLSARSDSDTPAEAHTASIPAESSNAATPTLEAPSELKPVMTDPPDRRVRNAASSLPEKASTIVAATDPAPGFQSTRREPAIFPTFLLRTPKFSDFRAAVAQARRSSSWPTRFCPEPGHFPHVFAKNSKIL